MKDQTFCLQIFFEKGTSALLREEVKVKLSAYGIDSFVEGSLDDLDIPQDYSRPARDISEELDWSASPIEVYSFSQEFLQGIRTQIGVDFPGGVICKTTSLSTESWQEGWKESLRPFATERFYIYPPWCAAEIPPQKIPVVIDPGMAFGTGQHATTQLCLTELETLVSRQHIVEDRSYRVFDVGSGSGILSIAAAKLLSVEPYSVDIDRDAVLATKENAKANGLSFSAELGSVENLLSRVEAEGGSFDRDPRIVMANILSVVLKPMIGQLARLAGPRGFLIMSGILDSDLADILKDAENHKLELISKNQKEDWVSVCFQKSPR